ncbi:MAG: cytochrome c, partial [Thermoanaerobaculia bacterium]
IALAAAAGLAGAAERTTSRPPPDGWELEGDIENGELIYKQYCQKCHGKRGNGQGTMAKDLNPKPRDFTDKETMLKRSDWEIYLGIKEGGAPVGLSDQMTSWEDALTEEEMSDVAVYIRQFAKPDEKGE